METHFTSGLSVLAPVVASGLVLCAPRAWAGACEHPLLGPPMPVTVSDDLTGLDAGDLDGDGSIDLVFSDNTLFNASVEVLINNGDGTYASPASYSVGGLSASSMAVIIEDFDEGLGPDIAVLGSNGVQILLNDGAGAFGSPIPAGSNGFNFAAGDLNGDGAPDIITTDSTTNNMSLLLNNDDGAGAFSTPQPVSAGLSPSEISLGFFDANASLDIAVVRATGGPVVSVLLNNGDGTFAGPVEYGVGQNPRGLANGDFDGDGDADLAVTNFDDGAVSVLLNNGNGSFAPQTAYSSTLFCFSMAVADMNADGDLDLVLGGSGSGGFGDPAHVDVLLGNGDGSFAAPFAYQAGGQFDNSSGLAVADLDGDETPDVAVLVQDTSDVQLLTNTCEGGSGCEADIDATGEIDSADLFDLLGGWGTDGPGADLAEPNDLIDSTDLFALLGSWGPCP